MAIPLPEFDQVRALPCVLERTVDDAHVDAVHQHLTVTGHLGLHVEASAAMLDAIGLTGTMQPGVPLPRPLLSAMDLEHHLRYVAEVGRGHDVAVHQRLLGRAERTFHGVRYLVDVTTGRLASSFEFISIHVRDHRAAPFGPEVAGRLDTLIARTADATDVGTTCASLSLRRR